MHLIPLNYELPNKLICLDYRPVMDVISFDGEVKVYVNVLLFIRREMVLEHTYFYATNFNLIPK